MLEFALSETSRSGDRETKGRVRKTMLKRLIERLRPFQPGGLVPAGDRIPAELSVDVTRMSQRDFQRLRDAGRLPRGEIVICDIDLKRARLILEGHD